MGRIKNINYYIPHCIVKINSIVEVDPMFESCMLRVFDWANRMGLEGKKVYSLNLVQPLKDNYDPLNLDSSLWCKLECTKEDREKWEQSRENQIKHAIHTLLEDDN